jgi:hypothetical protein
VLLTVAILYALIIYALVSAASADDNSCFGIVKVGEEWSTITDHIGQPGPEGPYACRFLTASRVGRHILSKCTDGSTCYIEMPMPRRGFPPSPVNTVKKVLLVERDPKCTNICSSPSCGCSR